MDLGTRNQALNYFVHRGEQKFELFTSQLSPSVSLIDQAKEALFRYGNWGGLNWSGGELQRNHYDVRIEFDAIDLVDEAFKSHDLAFIEAAKQRDLGNFAYAASLELSANIDLFAAQSEILSNGIGDKNGTPLSDTQIAAAVSSIVFFSNEFPSGTHQAVLGNTVMETMIKHPSLFDGANRFSLEVPIYSFINGQPDFDKFVNRTISANVLAESLGLKIGGHDPVFGNANWFFDMTEFAKSVDFEPFFGASPLTITTIEYNNRTVDLNAFFTGAVGHQVGGLPNLAGSILESIGGAFSQFIGDVGNLLFRYSSEPIFKGFNPFGFLPVAIDLDGDGVELVSSEVSTAHHDLDGDGFRERSGWVGKDDGLLGYDANHDGKIEGAAELSFTQYLPGAKTDLEGLKFFDSNQNGKLDVGDTEFQKFRIWQDRDQDGISTGSELQGLSQIGLQSILLTSDQNMEVVGDTTVFGITQATLSAGVVRDVADLGFKVDRGYGVKANSNGELEIKVGKEISKIKDFSDATQPFGFDAGANGFDGVIGGIFDEHLYTSANKSVLMDGASGHDLLNASAEDDVLFGGLGNDRGNGHGGNDFIFGDLGNDILDGGAGEDRLSGGLGRDSYYGGAGDDLLLIGQDDLTHDTTHSNIDGGEGLDTAIWQDQTDANLKLNANIEVVMSQSGNDLLMSSGAASVTLVSGAGNDSLVGADFDDVLLGEDGNDVLLAAGGNDTMSGGAGDDTYFGGAGDDLYVIGTGAGVDTIQDSAGGNDRLLWDVALTDVLFSRDGAGNQIFETADGRKVVMAPSSIEQVEFAHGVVITMDVARQLVGDRNSSQHQNLSAVSPSNGVWATGGNGGDYFKDLSGKSHVLFGGGGQDQLTSDGNDIFSDGFGEDILWGNLGDDVYVLSKDSDIDAIREMTGNDRLVFADDVEGVTFVGNQRARDVTGHIIRHQLTGDGSTVYGIDHLDLISAASSHLGLVGDSYEQVASRITHSGANDEVFGGQIEVVVGTKFNDQLIGSDLADTFYGGEGDDVLAGGGAADLLYGGSGDDQFVAKLNGNGATLDGGAGFDLLIVDGTAGYVNLTSRVAGVSEANAFTNLISIEGAIGGQFNDTIIGSDEANYLEGGSGIDTIYGGDGNDLIKGGKDGDTIFGGNGDDTFIFGMNDGFVTFSDTGGGRDIVQFDEGLSIDNLRVTGGGGNFNFQFGNGFELFLGTTIEVTPEIEGIFGTTYYRNKLAYQMGSGDGVARLDSVKIGNDIVIITQDITNVIRGAEINETLDGSSSGSWLDGAGGDDRLLGSNNRDVLSGGLGNDFLDAGAGDDALFDGAGLDSVYGGAGNDHVYASVDLAGNFFDGGVGVDQFCFAAAGAAVTLDMVTGVATFTGSVTDQVKNFEVIKLTNNNDVLNGTSSDDTIFCLNGQDQIFGHDGNDLIDGSIGSDTLNGGNGDDRLFGGNDNDVLLAGLGEDQAFGGEGDDRLEASSGNDVMAGGAGHDQLFGEVGDDILHGDDGNDVISGAQGADQIFGGNGDDYVSVDGGETEVSTRADIAFGGAGNDQLVVAEGDRGLALFGYGGDGHDRIVGGLRDDALDGGIGNDLLFGGAGNDTFIAGGGVDTIDGGVGDELVLFVAGDGTDTFVDQGGDNDKLLLSAGLAVDDITVTGGGGHYRIQISANDVLDVVMNNTRLDFIAFGDDIVLRVQDIVDVQNGTSDPQGHGTPNGASWINGHGGDDVIQGHNQGSDVLIGGTGNDTIYGHGSNDGLFGGIGDDQLYGGGGVDLLVGGLGADQFFGGAEDKVSYAQAQAAVAFNTSAGFGTSGEANGDLYFGLKQFDASNHNDNISAGSGHHIRALAGDDFVYGGTGFNTLDGGAGNDQLVIHAGEAFRASMVGLGGSGDDTLVAGDLTDTLFGGEGSDTINGGQGSDSLYGDAGTDLFLLGVGASSGSLIDKIFGGSEFDQISLQGFGAGWAIHLNGVALDVTTSRDFTGVIFNNSQLEVFVDNVRQIHAEISEIEKLSW